ncbi:MAG: multifunctional CCA addition/repair protein [Gammaproteobacteria bacterium]|nr:multifunctional CCA addition/repair protein [Gammaproteobacteria bacterium]MDH5691934.1 multifunctional CCA addition/repair protein [Gammaproteobacteria bacterium]
MKTYLVGGAVRDRLLGLTVNEKDWVVIGSSIEEMLAHGYQQVGKDFPVFLHPDTKEEYALARTERKTGRGYKGFAVDFEPTVSLRDDLLRRDLTINAMALDETGNLIDPYQGTVDLSKKILRHVSDAFVEDPLRVLRVARFAARFHTLGFIIANETLELMKAIVNQGEMEELVAERVWIETLKALKTEQPSVYFNVLKSCGALKVLFPEVDKLFGIPQPEKYHPEIDTGVHTMMVLDQAARLSADPVVRWAALVHDLGKGETPPDLWPKHHGHEALSVTLNKKLSDRLRIPKDFSELADLVAKNHGKVHKVFELKASTLIDMLNSINIWRNINRLEPFLLACEADSRGRSGYEDSDYPQAAFIKEVVEACKMIDVKPFLDKGLQGGEIAEAIRGARIKIANQLKMKRMNQSGSNKQDQ